MVTYWTGLCGNSSSDWAYWSDNFTWLTPHPDLTICFQKTVLQWIPCGFLFICCLIYIPVLCHMKTVYPSSISKFSIFKLIVCAIIIGASIADLTKYLQDYNQSVIVPPILYINPCIEIAAQMLAGFLIVYQYWKGVRTSAVLFFFWLLQFAVRLFIAMSQSARLSFSFGDQYRSITSLVIFACAVVQLICHSFNDGGDLPSSKTFKMFGEGERQPLLTSSSGSESSTSRRRVPAPCPEIRASFLSKFTFTWITGFMIRGYRRPINFGDLWDLREEDTAVVVNRKTEKEWKRQIHKAMMSNRRNKLSFDYSPDENDTEDDQHRWLQEIRSVSDFEKKKAKPSIFVTVRNVFGPLYMFAGVLKLIADMLNFVQPQILKALIGFISVGDIYQWHGYLFAGCLFLIGVTRTMILQHYMNGTFVTGLRLRTAVVSLVYRKALCLSGLARKNTTVGQIVNLMSVDAQKFQDAPGLFHIFWTAPITIIVAIVFLWQELGASALAGVAVMFLMIPINVVLVGKGRKLQIQQMRMKDERIKLMSEMLSGMKVLKLYAWEKSFEAKVNAIRNRELKLLRTINFLSAFGSITWVCAPLVVSLITFAFYVLVSSENVLTSQKAFVSLSLFNIIKFPMSILPACIAYLIQFTVSVGRLNRYMMEDEMDPNTVEYNDLSENAVTIVDGDFTWDQDNDPVLSNINLAIPRGKLVAVVGSVGSGKSSLISAVLGEMVKQRGRVIIGGNIAYVPQEAWIRNCTVRENILFGKRMCRARYECIIDACSLRPDLEVLVAGDRTEIGERGINLSGGQKHRVSLARAIYQDADIYLLDDPLAAVDAHVGKHLLNEVISKNGMLAHKTRILVTNSLQCLPEVDCILVIRNGRISEAGTYNELLSHNGPFAEFVKTYLEKDDLESEDEGEETETIEMKSELRRTIQEFTESEADTTSAAESRIVEPKPSKSPLRSRHQSASSPRSRNRSGDTSTTPSRRHSTSKDEIENLKRQQKNDKLVTEEKAEVGSIRISTFSIYFTSLSLAAVIVVIISYLCYIASQVSTNLWLSVWSEDTTVYNNTARRDLYLGVYGGFGAIQLVMILTQSLAFAYGSYFASRKLHGLLLANIMRTPLTFFDTTPIGRIINRFSKDVDTVDVSIPQTVRMWMGTVGSILATIVVISIASPIILVAMIPLSVGYYIAQRFYISTSRQLKRLDSIRRSPIYSHFQESVIGASSIRAYRRQIEFAETSDRLVDESQMVYFPNITSYRWLGVILELIGNLITLLAAVFAVASKDSIGAGLAGASITYALQITGSLNFVVRTTCDLENFVVAVERIMEYATVQTEASWREHPRPSSLWPQDGQIRFKDYSLRYRPGLDLVLRSLNCTINPGEKVGIVGRTGAGKSSLALGLFRIIEPATGSIEIDGENILRMGLHDLRSRITIIPQDPVLFTGTLRMNLDPFDAHSDGQLWTALEQAHLKDFISSLPEGLEHKCSERGENLSLGQRQLVCLARALLRKTKVLVLDEATAAVDLETDDLIQNTIRTEFQGCTILTIAHRLHTIMDYDRIMVLDKGLIKEFDTPTALMANPNSMFARMCEDANLM